MKGQASFPATLLRQIKDSDTTHEAHALLSSGPLKDALPDTVTHVLVPALVRTIRL